MSNAFTYTSDFQREFLTETNRLLRRRFFWLIWLTVAAYLVYLLLPAIVLAVFGMAGGPEGIDATRILTKVGVAVVDLGVSVGFFLYGRRTATRHDQIVRLAFWFFVYHGAAYILTKPISEPLGFPWLLMAFHILAAVLLPWTLRQAIRPMIWLLLLNGAGIVATAAYSIPVSILVIALTPISAVPGALIAWLKHERRTEVFKLRFLQNRYGQMRRELVDARRIHESLFPPPRRDGPLRFDYRYEPMRQIGGDYLFAGFSPSAAGDPPAFNMIVLDVTGHGIAAALTVNRLCGEVERLYAEDPTARPGAVLKALNRYIHLTMANHSIYATALCVRVEPDSDALEYASGGHPPAFLRGADGTVDQLDSTSLVLGACADRDFDPAPQRRPFLAGDTLIAYTDGAIEARNQDGAMLGVQGLLCLVSGGRPPKGANWAESVLNAVEEHRSGPPADDTLVVEVTRALDQSFKGARSQSARGVEPILHPRDAATAHAATPH